MTKYETIMAALHKSVAELVAQAPENLAEELGKRFEDAGEALGQQLDADLPLEAGEADHVSFFEDSVHQLTKAAVALRDGNVMLLADNAPSDSAITLALHAADLGHIALQSLVNEEVEIIEKASDLGEGEALLKMDDGEGGDLLLKTALPEQMHELIVTADEIDNRLAEIGASLLAHAGIAPHDLAKAFPMKGRRPPTNDGDEEDGEDEEDEDPEDEDEEYEDQEDDGAEDDEEDDGPTDPVELIAEMGGMILIQVDALRQAQAQSGGEEQEGGPLDVFTKAASLIVVQADEVLKGGSMDDGMDDADSVDASGGDPRMAAMGKVDSPEAEEALAKAAAAQTVVEELNKRLAESKAELETARAQAEKLGKMAAPAKAVTGAGAAVTKEAEMGHAAAEDQESEAKRLAKLNDEKPGEGTIELLKKVHAGGGVPFTPFR